MRPVVPLLLAVLTLAPASAAAGPFDLFGFGARAIAMGGAATAVSDDHTAVFYNPANLTVRKTIHLAADFLTTVPSLDITLDDRETAVAPLVTDSHSGLGLGVLFPLGGKIDYRLAFGLVMYIPMDDLLRVDSVDPMVPRWYIWDGLADKLQILFGLGGEITEWLSVGIGAQSLASITGDSRVEVDPINGVFPSRDISVEIINTVAPIAGLRVGPFYGLQFGFSWRAPLQIEFELPIRLDFGDPLDVALIAKGEALFTPHTLSFGLAWDIPDTGWLVTVETRYALWSKAPDPSLQFDLDITGDLIAGLGVGDAFDFVVGPSAFPQLLDVWTLHMGAELWATEHLVGRLGYSFRPTPVPPQVGPTNYVDNDTHTVAAGFGISYPDPLNLDDQPLTFEFSTAYSILPEQRTEKESVADPVGAFTHGGNIWSFALSLRHDF